MVLVAVRSKAVVLLVLIVTPNVRFCNCSMFCCALLCVHSSFAIILIAFALVSRDRCMALPHVPWVCLQFVFVVFADHTHLLFFVITLNLHHLI